MRVQGRFPGGVQGQSPWLSFLAWLAASRSSLVLFLPVLLGVGDVLYFSLRWEPVWWLGPALALLIVVVLLLCWRWLVARCALLALAGLAGGFAAAQLSAARAAPAVALPARAAVISGRVSLVESLPAGQRVTLAAPVLAPGLPPLPRTLRIRLRADDPALPEVGDTVSVRALVRPPAPPAYPGAWDLQRDAWFAGIGGYGYALGPVTLTPGKRSVWGERLAALRRHVAQRAEAALSGSVGAIAATLLTGLAAGVPADDRAAFRDSGLAHLLAIAGLHIGIVMGLVFGGTRLLLALSEQAALRLPLKQIAAVAALAAGAGYLLLTGAHVPILRSFTMAAVVLLALLSGRRAVSLRGLLLAAAVLILIAPEELLGVSYQMSFSAVLALIAGYEALRPALTRLHGDGGPGRRLLHHLATLGLTSLLAGAASAPFAAYHFGHIQLYFVLANMVAVPLTALWIMPAGLAALLLMPLGLDGPAFWVMGWGIRLVLWVAHGVAAWPDATVAVPHMPDWGLALVALGLTFLGLWRGPARLAGMLPLLLGLASPWLIRPPDLLISSDAHLIALRTPQGVFAQMTGADRFTRDAYAQFWASTPLRPLTDGAATGAVACTDARCELRPRPGGPAALLVRTAPPDPCGPDLLLAAEPVRACPAIDRFAVWRDGAQAVWLGQGGPSVLSDRGERGARQWVALGPERRTATTLPMAKTEDLPADPP